MTKLTAVEQLSAKRQTKEVCAVLTALGLGYTDAPVVAGNIVSAFYAQPKGFSHPAQLVFNYSLEEIAGICEADAMWDEQGECLDFGDSTNES